MAKLLHYVCRFTALAACACSGDMITEPVGLVDFEPLPVYETWYQQVQTCAGIAGSPLDGIRWRQLPGATELVFGDTTLVAYWLPPAEIVISGWYVTSERIVKHELLHSLLRFDPHHRDERWARCEL